MHISVVGTGFTGPSFDHHPYLPSGEMNIGLSDPDSCNRHGYDQLSTPLSQVHADT